MHDVTRNPGKDGADGAAATLTLTGASQVVEALNAAIDLDAPPAEKARYLLEQFQALLGHDADVELWLQADLRRVPAPRLVERIYLGPTFARFRPPDREEMQAIVDATGPLQRQIVPDILDNLRTPRTTVFGEDLDDKAAFARLRDAELLPRGWTDVLTSSWASGADRMVMLVLLRRHDGPPLGAEARQLTSLMLRAIAPIVDREMFDTFERPARAGGPSSLLDGRDLSGRQTDVLHLLLRGLSEKEAARELGVSTHTVHTHVKKLYSEFDVSSRGELLARFVDRRILKRTSGAE